MADRKRRLIALLAAVVAAAGITLIAVAAAAQKSPPRPSSAQPRSPAHSSAHSNSPPRSAAPTRSSAARPTRFPEARPTRSPEARPTRGPILARSIPVSLDIPAIGVRSRLLRLGLNADGTVQVPPVERANSPAGWYDESPTPGQLGPAIILGHIDSAKYGPGIFFRLGALHRGDRVEVTRSDGTVAVFGVDRVAEYSKRSFPTLDVYGNIDHAGLRLITCGGTFDPAAHSYDDNIVAYASLISLTSPR